MLRSRLSARSCSARSSVSASSRCLREQRQQREHGRPADGDVERQHQVREPLREAVEMGPTTMPARPQPRKTTRKATYQRIPARTPLNTRAPSGARMPQIPTAPDGTKPPSGIIEMVGATRIAAAARRAGGRSSGSGRTRGSSRPRPRSRRTPAAGPAAGRHVEDAPGEPDRQDDDRDQDEQRLPEAGLVVVVRVGAHGGDAQKRAIEQGSERRHRPRIVVRPSRLISESRRS